MKIQIIPHWKNFSNIQDPLIGMTKNVKSRKLNQKIKSLILESIHLVQAYKSSWSLDPYLYKTVIFYHGMRRNTVNVFQYRAIQILNKWARWKTKLGVYSSDVITMVSRRILMSHPRTTPSENISSDFDQPKKKRLKNRKWRKRKKKNQKLKNS